MEIKKYAEVRKQMLERIAEVYKGYLEEEIEGLINACEGVKEGDMGFLYVALDHAAKAITNQAKMNELEAEARGVEEIASRF